MATCKDCVHYGICEYSTIIDKEIKCKDWIRKGEKSCQYCKADNNDFILLNKTADYSGIEIALNRQGMLRVRYYADDSQVWFSEDIINVKFCPVCGGKIT